MSRFAIRVDSESAPQRYISPTGAPVYTREEAAVWADKKDAEANIGMVERLGYSGVCVVEV